MFGQLLKLSHHQLARISPLLLVITHCSICTYCDSLICYIQFLHNFNVSKFQKDHRTIKYTPFGAYLTMIGILCYIISITISLFKMPMEEKQPNLGPTCAIYENTYLNCDRSKVSWSSIGILRLGFDQKIFSFNEKTWFCFLFLLKIKLKLKSIYDVCMYENVSRGVVLILVYL